MTRCTQLDEAKIATGTPESQAAGVLVVRRAAASEVSTTASFFANSGLSGISIFEEAQYLGMEAAQKALAKLSGRY